MDRDVFLTQVRSSMATSELPMVPDTAPGGMVPDLSSGQLVERFSERCEAVDGSVHHASSDEAAVLVVSQLLERYEASDYLAWDSAHLPVAGLIEGLPGNQLSAPVPSDAAGRSSHQNDYMNLRVGITGAIAGLAESGSLVLDSGPGRPRMASLIPLAHIALLRAEVIAPSLSHWIADNPTAAADTSNLVVITGPSRTADIEQVLNLGVHGPKYLHVVVVASGEWLVASRG